MWEALQHQAGHVFWVIVIVLIVLVFYVPFYCFGAAYWWPALDFWLCH